MALIAATVAANYTKFKIREDGRWRTKTLSTKEWSSAAVT